MGRVFYSVTRTACRLVMSQTIRSVVLHPRRAEVRAPFIIACTHVGHIEPAIVTCLLKTPIDWMSRKEFFRHRTAASILHRLNAFSVKRQGVPVTAIRAAMDRLQHGRIVGIFPEGGIATGTNAIFRGGPMKAGVCVIAQRAGVPVLPVVILGTEALKTIDPWLPMRRGRVWVNFGKLVWPVAVRPPRNQRRAARQLMARQLQEEFIRTHQELCRTCALDESHEL